MPRPPPAQTGPRLAADTTAARRHAMDHPFRPHLRHRPTLTRSYLILTMQIRATTCRSVVRGKTTFWLHDLGRSGERAVRRRSLMIKELPPSTLPLVFLATSFGPSCEVFARHQPFAADTPT